MRDLVKTGKLKMLKSQPKTPYKRTHKFDNGYGASVIMNDMSYGGKNGLYEIAVTLDGSICYDTEITDNVIGHLTLTEVDDILENISNLSPKT